MQKDLNIIMNFFIEKEVTSSESNVRWRVTIKRGGECLYILIFQASCVCVRKENHLKKSDQLYKLIKSQVKSLP